GPTRDRVWRSAPARRPDLSIRMAKPKTPANRQTEAPDLSVVIPVWNAEHALGRLLPRLARTLASTVSGPSEVVVVLPRGEPVAALVERTGARVATFDPPGYGSALQAGLSAARGRWVITMDADFSHHP